MVDATEAAQKLAEERGLSLEAVEGTGSEGRITKEDVEAASRAETGIGAEEAPGGETEEETVFLIVNPTLDARSYTTGDGKTFFRDSGTPATEAEYQELRKLKIGGSQILVKDKED